MNVALVSLGGQLGTLYGIEHIPFSKKEKCVCEIEGESSLRLVKICHSLVVAFCFWMLLLTFVVLVDVVGCESNTHPILVG